MLFENRETTNQLNLYGVKFGDKLTLTPLVGKKISFDLNRTAFDFVCEKNFDGLESMTKKKLVTLKNEEFHVVLKEVKARSLTKEIRKRYYLEVLRGGAVRHNGNLTKGVFVERGDICEIGYNVLSFEAQSLGPSQDSMSSFVENNKRLITSRLPILIEGETGTGKTSLAKKIHAESGVIGKFVHINLSAFSQSLIESELFGHVKGAFTGAIHDKKGAFEQAHRGTLFIDEIDSLPISLQTKLLLFFDDFTARAVGGSRNYKVKTRLLFASGRELKGLVSKGAMRADFYYRLSSGKILSLKPLRDSSNLVKNFCLEFSDKNNIFLTRSLIDFYTTLPWPGNYRQLKGHLERKVALSSSRKIDFDESDESMIEGSSELEMIHDDLMSLKDIKIMYAKKVYRKSRENIAISARKLGISSKSLKLLIAS